jgi:hypothetical protein
MMAKDKKKDKGKLIATEAMFVKLVRGNDDFDVNEISKMVLSLGLKVQREKRRIFSRDLRIEYEKNKDAIEAEKAAEAKKAARRAKKAEKKAREKKEREEAGLPPESDEDEDDDDDDDDDDDTDEEDEDKDENGDGDGDGADGDGKMKKDEPEEDEEKDYGEPTEEERREEKDELQLIEAKLRQGIKDIVPFLALECNNEYRYGVHIAEQFLTQHYENLDSPQRDKFSLLLSFTKDCSVNLGSGNYFEGCDDTTQALLMAFGDLPITREIIKVEAEESDKPNTVTALTVTTMVSVDGDKPRRVMEMMDIGLSTDYSETSDRGPVNRFEECYVIQKLLTVVQDPRPLYLFADAVVPKTKRDNMEPWARALIPLTEEEIKELEMEEEAKERELMAAVDAESMVYDLPLRKEEARIRKEKEDKEKAAKYGFGSDDEDEDGDEDGNEEEGGEGDDAEAAADADVEGGGEAPPPPDDDAAAPTDATADGGGE